MEKIMVPFLSPLSSEAAFDAAAPFVKRFKAQMDVVHAIQRPSVAGDFYYPVGLTTLEQNIDSLNAKADELARQLKALFGDLCARHQIDAPESADMPEGKAAAAFWSQFDGDPSADLAYRARVADMTVVAPPSDDPPFAERTFCEDMVFQSGRPVLLARPGAMKDFPKTVIVAWDGGREAARALHAALPILKECDLAVVATAGDTDWAAEAPETAAAYLRLHDVRATHLQLRPGKGDDPEDLLMEHAKKKNADLIVMGAYSHQRWKQIVLGGFTRRMLKSVEIPILMTH